MRSKSSAGFTLIEIMIVVLIFGIVISIAIPGFLRARSNSQMKTCQENLTKLVGAKIQWAMENSQDVGATPTSEHLVQGQGLGYLKVYPVEPAGGTYRLNDVGTDPTCSTSLLGHSVPEIGQTITTVN